MRLLTIKQVAHAIGVSRQMFHLNIRYMPGFPKEIKIGMRPRWVESEIEEWVKLSSSRAASR